MDDQVWIYESPDGGDTVYRRLQGNNGTRQLHSVSEKKQNSMQDLKNDQLWHEIRCRARTDSVLNTLLEHTETYYRLRCNANS